MGGDAAESAGRVRKGGEGGEDLVEDEQRDEQHKGAQRHSHRLSETQLLPTPENAPLVLPTKQILRRQLEANPSREKQKIRSDF